MVEFVFRPLSMGDPWEDDGKSEYDSCRFKASYSDTMGLLKAELRRIGVYKAVIEVDLPDSKIRLDGLPRAGAVPDSPRIRLSFELDGVGWLCYPCDTYNHWHHNLRAIAKTLEAQRAMDRYGATRRKQQYKGWAQLPAGDEEMSPEVAAYNIAQKHRDIWPDSEVTGDLLLEVPDQMNAVLKDLYRRFHPDTGGEHADADVFDQVRKWAEVIK